MALQGTLKDFSLADIFQLIGLQKKTGILTLRRGEETVTVSFLDGNVVAADSLPRRLEDRLGTVLVRSRQVTESQLQLALKLQKQTLRRLGNVLVEQRYLGREALQEALRIQIGQMIYRLFRWRDGEYHFSQDEKVEFDRENTIPLSAESMLMEGARILDEWPLIEKRIGGFTTVYRRTEAATKALAASPGKSSPVLSPEEVNLLRALEVQRSVQELVDSSPSSEFDTCRVLYEVVGRQLAERIAGDPVGGTRKARPRSASAPGDSGKLSIALRGSVLLLAGLSFASADFNPLNGLDFLVGKAPGQERFLHQVSVTRLERLRYAIEVYYLQNRGFPQDLNYLAVGGFLRPSDLRDPWGREYGYRLLRAGYILQGFDPSGNPDSGLSLQSGGGSLRK